MWAGAGKRRRRGERSSHAGCHRRVRLCWNGRRLGGWSLASVVWLVSGTPGELSYHSISASPAALGEAREPKIISGFAFPIKVLGRKSYCIALWTFRRIFLRGGLSFPERLAREEHIM